MLSGEAFVHAISQKKKKEFGWVKIGFDCTLMTLACITSLLLSGGVTGVREGTIIAALLVGIVARYFLIRFICKLNCTEQEAPPFIRRLPYTPKYLPVGNPTPYK